MSRSHPLSYPAPQPSKRHFHPLLLIHQTGKRKGLLDTIFSHPFMRGPFKKISGHGTIPILIGAAVVAEGHSHLLVRGIAIVLCALWLSLDAGVWISETNWRPQYKAMWFCVTTCTLSCLAMGVMYWFLLSTLEDQQTDVYANLSIQMQLPKNSDLFQSVVTVTNRGATNIGEHEIGCYIDRLNQQGGGGIQYIAGEASSVAAPLLAGGDTQSDTCLHQFNFAKPPVCGDIYVYVYYFLETQPAVKKVKVARFVTHAVSDRINDWAGEPVSYTTHYCPPIF
jgi:hypothetical protein